MGVIQHEILLVIGDKKSVNKARRVAVRELERHIKYDSELKGLRSHITDIVTGWNGHTMFTILPSGSKVYWAPYNALTNVVDKVKSVKYVGVDVLYLTFGDYEAQGSITSMHNSEFGSVEYLASGGRDEDKS